MLVTFKTTAYSDITMFGTAAVSLLKMMGQSGNVPGAIMASDIPVALEKLKTALQKLGHSYDQPADAEPSAHTPHILPQAGGDDDDVPVTLDTRAGPLIQLLEAAAEAGESVLWDK